MTTAPAASDGAGASRTTMWPAAIGIATILSVVAPCFLTGALVVRMRADFPFSDTALGLAIGLSYTAGALTSWPAGKVADRVGPASAVQLGNALAFTCSLGVALLAQSALAVTALLVLAGWANAFGSPGAAILVRRHLPHARQGFAIGLQQAGAPAGALLAGLALPLIAVPFGWRAAFVVAAATAAATALAAGRLRGREPVAMEATAAQPAEDMTQAVRLGVVAALGNVALGGMIAFVVTAAVDAGAGETIAGAALALASLGALAARIGFGARLDHLGGRALAPVPAMFAAGTTGLLLCATGSPAAILVGAVVAGTLGWGWSGLTLLAAIEANPHAPGASAGVVMTGVYVGAASGPIVFGLLTDHASVTAAWLTAAALLLVGSWVALAASAAERLGTPPRSA